MKWGWCVTAATTIGVSGQHGKTVDIARISLSDLSFLPSICLAFLPGILPAMMAATTLSILAIAPFLLRALAQSPSCSTTLTPTNSVQPSVASGYHAQLIATGLSSPRSLKFDKAGNLLVIEQKNGNGSVSALTLQDKGGTCLSVASHTTLVTQSVRDIMTVGFQFSSL